MTAAEYRAHPQAPLRRAFFRGEGAAKSGLPLSANPYRKVCTTVRARRGSWSEAYSQAWAVGWRHVKGLAGPGAVPAVAGVREEKSR